MKIMTILDIIIEHKFTEVEKNKINKPIDVLKKSSWFEKEPLSLKKYLMNKSKPGIIAEFKRKSPSKGIINNSVKIEEVVKHYEESGVSGISVLTDFEFFGGTIEDLLLAREVVNIPILRKEFIIDEYQLIESKSIGADAILLIASVLTKDRTKELASFAKSLGLEILFEVHERAELEKINDFIDMVGVNNRDLKTFKVSIDTSKELFNEIPDKFLKISESGISDPENIKALKNIGYQGFLIGENFMKTGNPGLACIEFIRNLDFFRNSPLERG